MGAVLLGPGNCGDAIASALGKIGDSLNGLDSSVNSVQIWDTTTPGVAQMTVASAFGDSAASIPGQTGTLGSLVGGDYAQTVLLTYNLPSSVTIANSIVIGAAFYTVNIAIEQAVLVHEMLHIYTQLGDSSLATALGIAWGQSDPSVDITNYLNSGCTVNKFQ